MFRGRRLVGVCLAAALLAACGSKKDKDAPRADPMLYYQRGLEFLRQGRADRAAYELEEAQAIDGQSPLIANTLGLAYIGMRDYAKARETFERVLILDPYFTEAHNNLGIVYGMQGDAERAVQQFQMVLRDPRYKTPEVAQFNIGRILADQGKLDEALLHLESAIGGQPEKPEWRYRYGAALAASGDFEAAAREYEIAVSLRPNYIEALFALGEAYVRLDQPAKAREALAKVIQISPATPLGTKAREYLQLMNK